MAKIEIGIYAHSKSAKLYKVHFVAPHSETGEMLVAYEALYDNPVSKFWIRPAKMWSQKVTVGGKKVPRFVLVNKT
jgi:hypothetical protein